VRWVAGYSGAARGSGYELAAIVPASLFLSRSDREGASWSFYFNCPRRSPLKDVLWESRPATPVPSVEGGKSAKSARVRRLPKGDVQMHGSENTSPFLIFLD
jgi:hypothetical protein